MDYMTMAALIGREVAQNNNAYAGIPLPTKTATNIALWSRMYRNEAAWLNDKIKSCNLPAAISSEIARLVTLELQTEVTGGARAKYINMSYQSVKDRLRQYVEYGCAKGGLIIKPYVSQSGIKVQFIQADKFFPLAYDDSQQISHCVFAEQITKGNRIYTRLETHKLENQKLIISNRAYMSSSGTTLGSEVKLSCIPEWSELMQEITFGGVDKMPWGYFRVPIANSYDDSNPLGTSVYGRAIDLIKEADIRYSQISWEYEAKEAAVHIGSSLLKDDPSDQTKKVMPKGKERLYEVLEFNTGIKDKPFLDVYSPDIRDESLIRGFNNQLRLIEFNCCLAYGTLSDPQQVDKTAEEIKTSKQRSYTMVSDTQMALQKALEDTVDALDFYCSIYHLCPAGSYEVSFKWDDSIVVDAEKERKIDREDVAMGVMGLSEYRAKWYGETPEEAEKNLPQQSEPLQ